jgi:hypothetical protein
MAQGYITLTPLDYDMTRRAVLEQMTPWRFGFAPVEQGNRPNEEPRLSRPVVRTARKKPKGAATAEPSEAR